MSFSNMDVRTAVELSSHDNRKVFARQRRQPWIADLAFASAIDGYLLGLEHASQGSVEPQSVKTYLGDLKRRLEEDHALRGKATTSQAAPVAER